MKRRRDESEPPSVDLISRLPDEILGSIISILPTKDAARTAVLSSRWRSLWHYAPLNLTVDYGLARFAVDDEERIAVVVSKILATHPGPTRRLSIGYIGAIILYRGFYAKSDGWFRSPALDGLEELDFDLGVKPWWPLPRCVLRFAPTLRVASFSGCDFHEINATPALHLPRLKQLKLYGVAISEATLHCLLTGCTALESLHLDRIHGLSTVRIISSTLRSIDVSRFHCDVAQSQFQELVIEDAPYLERLVALGPFGGPRTARVLAAPKLMVLGYLSSKMSKIVNGTLFVQVEQIFFFWKLACIWAFSTCNVLMCVYRFSPGNDPH